MSQFTESVIEDAALTWLESLGYAIKHGPEITPGGDNLTLTPSRRNYFQQGNSWRMSCQCFNRRKFEALRKY
jgi:hypothetical protein